MPEGSEPVPITVVVATRDRAAGLRGTVRRLASLPERPRLIVVDNASTDGSATAVREACPQATVIRLRRNHGASARNTGARHARTPYVAFSDDDSWWEPGSLARACEVLAASPQAALVTGRTLVGPRGEPDPLNAVLAASPLPSDGLPGRRVLGFLGCAAVVRREAFLSVGGYSRLLHIGGEEQLLAADLAAAGWACLYLEELVARHFPSPARDVGARRYLVARNEALIGWLRRPARRALGTTGSLLRRAPRDPAAARAVASLALGLPRALASRRVVPPWLEAQLRTLEAQR